MTDERKTLIEYRRRKAKETYEDTNQWMVELKEFLSVLDRLIDKE